MEGGEDEEEFLPSLPYRVWYKSNNLLRDFSWEFDFPLCLRARAEIGLREMKRR